MKLIKTALMATSLTVLSANVFAGQYFSTSGNLVERSGTRTIQTEPVGTAQEAYKLGLEQLQSLNNSTPQELIRDLRIASIDIDRRKVHLNENGYITVKELMNADGELLYKGQVNVSYHYAERVSNN
ncbi:DUF3316 domain-containing protein [Vibrio sp. ZSDE26]|uniref:DUF3316 domain-containing protein n=1 Tax=Vibrio amylolyticus TaxID=2847292 RepID=A0A9X1XKA3_9VIBR|nr:DUF3316 domain-containing protein [Vibrio amylolyticus]MCK6264497.1 DUF3316 domain-containing protein [Vibrio amylolyticus]